MNSITEYKDLIEKRLDIRGTLCISGDKIVISSMVNKKLIKDMHIDDLFKYHNGCLYFTTRMLNLVGELTDRKIACGHYSLELKEVKND